MYSFCTLHKTKFQKTAFRDIPDKLSKLSIFNCAFIFCFFFSCLENKVHFSLSIFRNKTLQSFPFCFWLQYAAPSISMGCENEKWVVCWKTLVTGQGMKVLTDLGQAVISQNRMGCKWVGWSVWVTCISRKSILEFSEIFRPLSWNLVYWKAERDLWVWLQCHGLI